MKHTPAPWKLNENGEFSREYSNYIKHNEEYIATIHSLLDGKNNEQKWLEGEANAKLIAAAPDLLEALQIAREYMKEFGCDDQLVFDRIDNAIRKTKYVR